MVNIREQPPAWSPEAVAEALEASAGLDRDEAEGKARELADLFDGTGTIEDTEVEKDERALLWSLLLEGVVTVETETRPHPEHGRDWRYFYWHLVPPERLDETEDEAEEDSTVYDDLPNELWRRQRGAA
jgi:hypothetical protein